MRPFTTRLLTPASPSTDVRASASGKLTFGVRTEVQVILTAFRIRPILSDNGFSCMSRAPDPSGTRVLGELKRFPLGFERSSLGLM